MSERTYKPPTLCRESIRVAPGGPFAMCLNYDGHDGDHLFAPQTSNDPIQAMADAHRSPPKPREEARPTERELGEYMKNLAPPPAAAPLPDRPYYVLPTGAQVKDVVAHLSYNVGVAAAYLFRAGRKPGNAAEDDIRKAIDHLRFELERLGK